MLALTNMDGETSVTDIRGWPSPFPRLWAYSRLFQNKLSAKLFTNEVSPSRVNDELPFSTRYYYYFWSNDPTEIIPGLFLGSAKNAADLTSIRRNNITCVINVTAEIEDFFENSNNIEYKHVHLNDTKEARIEDIEESFMDAVDHIHFVRETSPILVHCFMGASRSVALVCAYLIKYHGKTLEEAYDLVKEKRNCIAMNDNFYQWLKKKEEVFLLLEENQDDG